MRVLLIAITYITRVNQRKLEEIVKLGDVQLHAVVPVIWRETLHPILRVEIPPTAPFSLIPTPTYLTGRVGRYFYRTVDLTMRQFQPDIVQVEEGWRGLTTFQAALFKRLWVPRARFVIFSWENMRRPPPVYQRVFQRFNLGTSDHVICGNEDGVASVRAAGYQGPVSVIPQLGVDTETFHKRDGRPIRSQLGLSPETFVIGFAGRMVPEKGALLLLEASAQLGGDWALLLIGDGPDRRRLEERAGELGILSRTRLVKPVPHLELANYYNAMDVLVSPSTATATWKEQFGLVLAQAMSSEVPVVGSTCGETPHLIGDAGLIFHEGNAAELRDCLYRLQAQPRLREELGKRGQARIQVKFSFRSVAERTYELWRNLN